VSITLCSAERKSEEEGVREQGKNAKQQRIRGRQTVDQRDFLWWINSYLEFLLVFESTDREKKAIRQSGLAESKNSFIDIPIAAQEHEVVDSDRVVVRQSP
jgi:hypothetical protein